MTSEAVMICRWMCVIWQNGGAIAWPGLGPNASKIEGDGPIVSNNFFSILREGMCKIGKWEGAGGPQKGRGRLLAVREQGCQCPGSVSIVKRYIHDNSDYSF